jgi:hypothetical protein
VADFIGVDSKGSRFERVDPVGAWLNRIERDLSVLIGRDG